MRRHPWRSGIAAIVAVLATAAGVIALRINSIASRRWTEFCRVNDAAVQRLRETGVPRNGWDAARPALGALARDMEARPSAPVDDLSGREALLDAIRAAVRGESAPAPPASLSHYYLESPELNAALAASALLAASARRRREAGDIPAAVEELVTGLQLAVDVSRAPLSSGPWYGGSMAQALADEAKALAVDPNAGSTDLGTLATLVDGSDRNLPEVLERCDEEYARLDSGIRKSIAGEGRPFDLEFMWNARRHGYSIRLLAADAMDAQERVLALARRMPSLDWPAASIEAEALQAELRESPNYFVMNMRWSLGASEKHLRETRARLREVRASVLRRLGRGASDPAWPLDPFTLKPLALDGR